MGIRSDIFVIDSNSNPCWLVEKMILCGVRTDSQDIWVNIFLLHNLFILKYFLNSVFKIRNTVLVVNKPEVLKFISSF
ncbi:hypothetical protein CDG61_16415 [Acinetobacter sp. WCHAc010052]|nr:hypothetical protein CDG61_16415 [Acinetobacter sp. WCHAc010052]